jgi:fucose permease
VPATLRIRTGQDFRTAGLDLDQSSISNLKEQQDVTATQPRLERDAVTVTAFVVLGLQGFTLNGLGSVLAPLGDQLGLSQAEAAVYPLVFAAALVIVGLSSGRLVSDWGHRRGLAVSVLLMGAGAALLGWPDHWPSLTGAFVSGMGAALAISLVTAVLTARHPTMTPAVLGEANAVASATALIAPAAVAAALAIGWGWRFGYVGPALAVGGLFIVGAGTALIYPTLLARAAAADPGQADRTTRLCTVMSGLAIGAVPLLLAQLANNVGLRLAYLTVPTLLLILITYCVLTLRMSTSTAVPDRPCAMTTCNPAPIDPGGLP